MTCKYFNVQAICNTLFMCSCLLRDEMQVIAVFLLTLESCISATLIQTYYQTGSFSITQCNRNSLLPLDQPVSTDCQSHTETIVAFQQTILPVQRKGLPFQNETPCRAVAATVKGGSSSCLMSDHKIFRGPVPPRFNTGDNWTRIHSGGVGWQGSERL